MSLILVLFRWLRRQINGGEEKVEIHHGSSSITASPHLSDWRATLWRITTIDKTAVVVIDRVELFVAKRRKFQPFITPSYSTYCSFMEFYNNLILYFLNRTLVICYF